MCLEWMFCDYILVCFKLNVKYELIKLGKGGLRYTQEYMEYVQNKTFTATRKEYVGWNGVSSAIVHNAPIAVW